VISLSHCNRTASEIAELLASLFSPGTSKSASGNSDHLAVRFAPRYRLAFTLLNEDAATDTAVVGWDIENAIARKFVSSS